MELPAPSAFVFAAAEHSAPYVEQNAARNIILLLVFFSGGFALAYQIFWIRMLSLPLGSTLRATAFVIASFFAGLALGNAWGGARAWRLQNPLRCYGVLELAVAGLAFLFPYALAFVDTASARFGMPVLLWGGTAGLVLLAAIPMGCVLPVLSPFFTEERGSSRLLSYLYGINTLGSCVGSLGAGLMTIRWFGVSAGNAGAAAGNFALATAILVLSTQCRRPPLSTAQQVDAPALDLRALFTAFLSGLTFMAWELFFLRYLHFYFRDTIVLYASVLAAIILASGAGDLVFGRMLDRVSGPKLFVWCMVGGTLTAVALAYGLVYVYPLLSAVDTRPGLLTLVAGLIVGGPAFLSSVAMPVLFQIASREKAIPSAMGRILAANTAGTICACLVFPLVVIPHGGMTVALWLIVAATACLIFFFPCRGENASPEKIRKLRCGAALAAAIVAGGVACRVPPDIPSAVLRQNLHHNLGARGSLADIREIREGEYGTSWLAVMPNGEQLLFSDRTIISRDRSASFFTEGFVPILAGSRLPQNVLSLCFGGGLSSYAAGLLPGVESFTMVDISSDNMELALRYFAANALWKDDPRVDFRQEDAFLFLKASARHFDLILAEPTPPYFGYKGAAFYTREFFQAAAHHLTPSGIFSMPLPCGQLSESETLNVMRTFASAFPHCQLWWNGVDPLLLGSLAPLTIHAEIWDELQRVPHFFAQLASISGDAALQTKASLPAAVLLTDDAFRALCREGNIYTLERPVLEFSSGPEQAYRGLALILQSLAPMESVRRATSPELLPDAYWQTEFERKRRRLVNMSVRMADAFH